MNTSIYYLFIFFLLSGLVACNIFDQKVTDIDNYLSEEELNKLTSSISQHMEGELYEVVYNISCVGADWGSGKVVFTFDKKTNQLKRIKKSTSGEEGSVHCSFYINEDNELFVYKWAGSTFGCIAPEEGNYDVNEQTVFLYKNAPAIGIQKNAKNYDVIDKAKAKRIEENLDAQIKHIKEQVTNLIALKSEKEVQNFYCPE